MSQDTTLNQLVIHKLTQAQYEGITTPDPHALYLTPDETACAYITQTFTDAQTGSWYRLWSDGWCEQGGIIGTSAHSTTLTLLQPYKDTNYSGTIYNQTSPYNYTYNLSFRPATTTTATLLAGTDDASTCIWTAQGYIS